MDLVIAHDQLSKKTLVEPCAQMKRNGYAIIPEVLNCTEAEELLSKLEASQLRRSRAGVRHLLGHPVVSAVANDPRLLGLAQEILGDQAFPFRATLFDKSPDANWLIHLASGYGAATTRKKLMLPAGGHGQSKKV